ncbi:MAG: MBL fold metallo-hydrolase [Actinobacteria bacterium]|nr:MBL fold metallo-hydrolase [Actinomycetota bacterium]
MKLTVVGCSGSYPTPGNPGSCYVIEQDGFRLVLDLGNGSLGPLQDVLDPESGDGSFAVLLSHCHVDHCADVAPLYVMRHYGPARQAVRLPLIGPSDVAARISAIYGMTDPADLDLVFDVRSFEPGAMAVGPFTIQVARAVHPVEAYSIRVSAGGRSITYSGDTGPNAALATLAAGTDIALFEASFVGDANPVDLHMTGADAGRAATAADAGLLLLTHLVTWNDDDVVLREASAEFSGPIERARPGMTITV